jgi:hypothetical protein
MYQGDTMMTKKTSVSLKVQNKEGKLFDAGIKYYRKGRDWRLEFTSPLAPKMYFIEGDVFECLTQLRLKLAKYGCKPLCAGARIDVYPSGMGRDMGDGLSAQVLSSDSVEHVHIFDYTEPDLIVSVEEQLNYYDSQFDYSYEFMIQHDNGSLVEGIISGNPLAKPNEIEFTSPVTPIIAVSGENMFESLQNLRRELAKHNYSTLCNGARIDAYALHDDLITYGGNYVHILTLGKVPNKEDKVNTFNYAEPRLITSIAEQENSYKTWLNSIKSAALSRYDRFQESRYYHFYFRLIKMGDLPLMWLFEINTSTLFAFDNEMKQLIEASLKYDNETDRQYYYEHDRKYASALSPLSPEQVEQIGCLRGEAIVGFVGRLSTKGFHPNRVFVDFMQKVIAAEAPKDSELQAAAREQQEGWLYIIDNRAADNEDPGGSPEDILGAFQIEDGIIVSGSYQVNENYLVFGNNGLFQLPPSLHEALINALLSL